MDIAESIYHVECFYIKIIKQLFNTAKKRNQLYNIHQILLCMK